MSLPRVGNIWHEVTLGGIAYRAKGSAAPQLLVQCPSSLPPQPPLLTSPSEKLIVKSLVILSEFNKGLNSTLKAFSTKLNRLNLTWNSIDPDIKEKSWPLDQAT